MWIHQEFFVLNVVLTVLWLVLHGGGANDADHIVFLIDAQKGIYSQDVKDIISALQKAEKKVDIALNKIDETPKEKLLSLANDLQDNGYHQRYFYDFCNKWVWD